MPTRAKSKNKQKTKNKKNQIDMKNSKLRVQTQRGSSLQKGYMISSKYRHFFFRFVNYLLSIDSSRFMDKTRNVILISTIYIHVGMYIRIRYILTYGIPVCKNLYIYQYSMRKIY